MNFHKVNIPMEPVQRLRNRTLQLSEKPVPYFVKNVNHSHLILKISLEPRAPHPQLQIIDLMLP